MINFTVPGDPIPQPRPRVTSRGVYYADRARGSKRKSYVDYKEWVRVNLLQSPSWRTVSANKNELAHIWKATTYFAISLKIYVRGHGLGDINAFLATVMDALEGAVWANDRQVSKATAERFYNDPNPRVEIEIEKMR